MDRLKVLEGESEAFSFFKTQEDEEEKAKKKKDCFICEEILNDILFVKVQKHSDGSFIPDFMK